MKFGPLVQEEMSFKEKVYGRRTDSRQRLITIAHLEPSAKEQMGLCYSFHAELFFMLKFVAIC